MVSPQCIEILEHVTEKKVDAVKIKLSWFGQKANPYTRLSNRNRMVESRTLNAVDRLRETEKE